MAIVSLKGMQFYAYHGYYEFERKIGKNFTVDVDVELNISGDPDDHIDQTFNYEIIYQVAEKYMQKKYKLLESVAFDIAKEIKKADTKIKKVSVSLTKYNPPVGGRVDRAVVKIDL
jgi:dihydroneopterin aldolase